jgi:hypothetical protein
MFYDTFMSHLLVKQFIEEQRIQKGLLCNILTYTHMLNCSESTLFL